MEEFDLTCDDFNEGEEIPKKFGYKHGNEQPQIFFGKRTSKLELEDNIKSFALIMDDPDAIKAVYSPKLCPAYATGLGSKGDRSSFNTAKAAKLAINIAG